MDGYCKGIFIVNGQLMTPRAATVERCICGEAVGPGGLSPTFLPL